MSEIIKKVAVPQNELPAIGKITGQYIVRYRIISEDKNRSSHWSPNYIIETEPLSEIQHKVNKDIPNGTIEALWTPPATLGLFSFDVYLRWSGGAWNYATTVSNTSYKTPILNGATSVQVAVQVPTKDKSRLISATLFESDPLSL